jgi:N-acetylmuramoyl-L-alanine amidase
MADRGFSDIGYHFVIALDGTVETGRPLSQPGAHCVGHNRKSIGICYIGGVDHKGNASDTRTISQKEALTRLILIIKQAFPNVRVHGHRDFARKECPSFDAASEYAGLTVHDFSRKR